MTPNPKVLFPAAVWFIATMAMSQTGDWDKNMNIAQAAYKKGQYAEAESVYREAVKEAEKFAPADTRLAMSLNALGQTCYVEHEYPAVEPLYKRALTIREKEFGANDPELTATIENYARLLRNTNRNAEAQKLEARDRAIKAKP